MLGRISALWDNAPRWLRRYVYLWLGIMGLYILGWLVLDPGAGPGVFYVSSLPMALSPSGPLMIMLVFLALSLATFVTILTRDTMWIAAVFSGIVISGFVLSIMGPDVFGRSQIYQQLDSLNRGGSTYYLTTPPNSDREENLLLVLRCDLTGFFCSLLTTDDAPTTPASSLGNVNLQAISGTIRVIDRDDGNTLYTYTP